MHSLEQSGRAFIVAAGRCACFVCVENSQHLVTRAQDEIFDPYVAAALKAARKMGRLW